MISARLPVLLIATLLLLTACGAEETGGGVETASMESMKEASSENDLTPAEAEVGPK